MEAEPGGGGGKSTAGSIAERRAARCGFKPTPRLNTARFRSVSPLSSPAIRSPFVTIPPGISPTALLDSPVMLLNPQVLPSPTTGFFQMPFVEYETMSQGVENLNARKESHGNRKCSFMSRNQSISPISISFLETRDNQMESEDHIFIHTKKEYTEELQQGRVAETATVETKCIANLHSESKQALCPDESLNGEDFLAQQPFEEDQSGEFATLIGRPSEDGYNWRKYGQKQVKGSEFPRSYYKCTYPSCQVKKKVEHSVEGQITGITYKGSHHHPKPQPNRRSVFSFSYSISELSGSAVGLGPSINVEGELVGRNSQQGSKDKLGVNLKAEGLEWTSSTSAVTEISDTRSPAQAKCSNILIEHPELSSTLASQVTDENDATPGSMMIENEGEGEGDEDYEFDSKRRKGENCLIDSNPVLGSAREPRVVVQTVSEVDILDDGYRWRKYGQKVVKGNPNPRSYYKCTHPECSVRKLVERASHDLTSVITTYEGKHNHEVPRAKNNSKSRPASYAQPSSSLLGPTSVSKLEKSRNLFTSCREDCELLSYRGSAGADPYTGAFPLQLPSLQPCTETDLSFPVSNFDPNLPIQFPISFLRPNTAFCYNGLDDQLKLNAGEVQPLLGQQQSMEDKLWFSMQPEQGQDSEDYDSPLKNLSSMHRFPG